MKHSISNAQLFVLLFGYVTFIAHTLAKPSQAVKNDFSASRQRYLEARLSAPSLPVANAADNGQSTLWSGASQLDQSAAFRSVSASWTVSKVSLPSPPTGAGQWGISQWIGIDGQPTCNKGLFQAGVWYYIVTDDNGIVEEQGAATVYQWYPGAINYTDYTVAEGDVLQVVVQATSEAGDAGTVTFSNPTTGAQTIYDVSSPGPDGNICGYNVEWILEFPDLAGWQLPDFGVMSMQSCLATRLAEAGPPSSVNLNGATLIDLVDSNDVVVGKSSLDSDTQVSVQDVVGTS